MNEGFIFLGTISTECFYFMYRKCLFTFFVLAFCALCFCLKVLKCFIFLYERIVSSSQLDSCILGYVKLRWAKKKLHTASISHTKTVCPAQSVAVLAFSFVTLFRTFYKNAGWYLKQSLIKL